MLYGIVSQKASIEDLFIGGLLPGLLMLGLLALLGVREGLDDAARSGRRSARAKRFAAIWEAKWELLLPVFVVGIVRRRRGDAGRVGADGGALHADRAALHPSRSAVVERRAAAWRPTASRSSAACC